MEYDVNRKKFYVFNFKIDYVYIIFFSIPDISEHKRTILFKQEKPRIVYR